MSNKVRYNLKNVHYALLSLSEEGVVTFDTPVHIPGAVSVSMSPEGGTSTFHADGIAYYVSIANNGYSGDLALALLPDEFREKILNEVSDTTDKVLVEYSNREVKAFALMFEFDGDEKAIRHVMYNCKAARPNVEGETVTESKDPSTETLSLTASPLADGRVKAKTTADTTSAAYADWYKKVWEPTVGPGEEPED